MEFFPLGLFPCVHMSMNKILLLHPSLSYCGSHMVAVQLMLQQPQGSLPFIGIARKKKNPLIILTLSIWTRYFFFFLSCSIFLNQDDHSYPKKKCFAIFASIVVSSPLQSSNPNFEKLSKFLFTCLFTSICPSHL